jgi:hypothetical protein
MYKLKKTAKRIAAFSGAIGFLSSIAFIAATPVIVSADPLNPLTARTLLLTSSSPGWAYTDGAGDTTYAPAGSGANGLKTGETFTFNTSTDSVASGVPLKAFTFQYCTTAAGYCASPGNDATALTDTSSTSDLNVAGSWSEGAVAGDFEIYTGTGHSANTATWTASSGWTMTASNLEDASSGTTGANNFITLVNSSGISPTADEPIKVVFNPSDTAYIENPGSDAFFVKINDYSSDTVQNFDNDYPTAGQPDDVVDGGVTVANVMNQSIAIQTKVLETMDFSVGTVDPDTLTVAEYGQAHGQCDSILGVNPTPTGANPTNDTLLLGDPSAEYSLSPTQAYGTTSLWRLSTNSANGATVYYTGNTLADTEGNSISPMTDNATSDAAAYAKPGTEQFGLGLNYTVGSDTNIPIAYRPGGTTDLTPYFSSLDSTASTGFTVDLAAQYNSGSQDARYWYSPTLSPLAPTPSYGDAIGAESGAFSSGNENAGPKFAFNSSANTIPVPIASEDTSVVDCSTGQVNYVADIAPSTPADVYTTKLNYLASPEY